MRGSLRDLGIGFYLLSLAFTGVYQALAWNLTAYISNLKLFYSPVSAVLSMHKREDTKFSLLQLVIQGRQTDFNKCRRLTELQKVLAMVERGNNTTILYLTWTLSSVLEIKKSIQKKKAKKNRVPCSITWGKGESLFPPQIPARPPLLSTIAPQVLFHNCLFQNI